MFAKILIPFITFVCAHAQCDPRAPGYSEQALLQAIKEYAYAQQEQEFLSKNPDFRELNKVSPH